MGTTGQSITLANSIIGVGILAMPFCFQQCGVLLATLVLLFMGLISRLCCHFLLKSALLARRRNFEFLAFHVFGSAGKLAVELGIIGFLMGTCIAYFVVVGDLGPQIIAKMFNINQSNILRTSIMVVVSLVCVLPLGLLRNVDSLSNVSAATIGFYFCLVIKVIAEAATQLMTSDWHKSVEMWRPAGLLQCVPIFSMALFCQTQLFEIFESLPTLSLEKMNLVTKNAINICTAVYFTIGLFGFIAFCSQDISGNILMSLSPTMASDVIKLGFVMSLAFSFPLIIFPCRASLYSFLYKKVHSSQHDHIINHSIPEMSFRCITVGIVAVALFVSLLIPNIELVLGLVGSTIGVLICVVFPASCFINITFKDTNERLLAKGVLVLGLVIMVLGTYANLEAAGVNSGKLDRYEEKYTQERIDKIVEDFFEKRDKDDIYLKPKESDPLPVKSIEAFHSENVIKDSEVQPPNPVPPESQSNEKIPDIKLESIKSVEKKIIAIIPDVKISEEKESETHPKSLKKIKPEALEGNGDSDTKPVKSNEPKMQSNEDKIDIIKQQELIETIKQHGEEQKELMKEQKEILDEIIKTKKELEQNKNEADTNEAKKIAVESIKQIANMAIQSLGGVTEKAVQVSHQKDDHLEKLTNQAVQEIAKKAVETIEAIHDIKDNPERSQVIDDHNSQNNGPALQDNFVQNNNNIQPQGSSFVQSQINSQDVQPANNTQNLKAQNVKLPSILPQFEFQNLQPQAVNPEISKSEANSVVDKKVETQNVADIVNPPWKVISLYEAPNTLNNDGKTVVKGNAREMSNVEKKIDEMKEHSKLQLHQSYKQDDIQAKSPDAKIPQNVPLAIAMNDLLSSKQIQEKEAVAQQMNDDIKVDVPQLVYSNNDAQPNRQKREVVDCTEKVALEPKDKEICDTLVDHPKDILPPLDIDQVALPKKLPMDVNMFHHISRSLKSYDKDQR